MIENIIYNHLIRLGYEVTVGQLQAGEIDFVCKKPKGQRIYVQASYIIADEATRERELLRLFLTRFFLFMRHLCQGSGSLLQNTPMCRNKLERKTQKKLE